MGTYTNVADVKALLPKGVDVNETERPAQSDVDTFITRTESRVHVALNAGGVSTPLSAGDKFNVVALLVSQKVAHMVLVARGFTKDPDHDPMWDQWAKEFDDALDVMADGDFTTPTDGSGSAWSRTMNGPVDDGDPDSGINARFTRDMRL